VDLFGFKKKRKRKHGSADSLNIEAFRYLPIAFPTAQKMKLMATATLFLVCPPTFLLKSDKLRVAVPQKERTR
jgi:hypothetical protein